MAFLRPGSTGLPNTVSVTWKHNKHMMAEVPLGMIMQHVNERATQELPVLLANAQTSTERDALWVKITLAPGATATQSDETVKLYMQRMADALCTDFNQTAKSQNNHCHFSSASADEKSQSITVRFGPDINAGEAKVALDTYLKSLEKRTQLGIAV